MPGSAARLPTTKATKPSTGQKPSWDSAAFGCSLTTFGMKLMLQASVLGEYDGLWICYAVFYSVQMPPQKTLLHSCICNALR